MIIWNAKGSFLYNFQEKVLRHKSLGSRFYMDLMSNAPLKFGRQKNVQNSARFRTTLDRSRISPERIKILTSEYRRYQLRSLQCSPIGGGTLVHQQQSFRGWCLPTQNQLFRKTLYRPMSGCMLLSKMCTHAREWGPLAPKLLRLILWSADGAQRYRVEIKKKRLQ